MDAFVIAWSVWLVSAITVLGLAVHWWRQRRREKAYVLQLTLTAQQLLLEAEKKILKAQQDEIEAYRNLLLVERTMVDVSKNLVEINAAAAKVLETMRDSTTPTPKFLS